MAWPMPSPTTPYKIRIGRGLSSPNDSSFLALIVVAVLLISVSGCDLFTDLDNVHWSGADPDAVFDTGDVGGQDADGDGQPDDDVSGDGENGDDDFELHVNGSYSQVIVEGGEGPEVHIEFDISIDCEHECLIVTCHLSHEDFSATEGPETCTEAFTHQVRRDGKWTLEVEAERGENSETAELEIETSTAAFETRWDMEEGFIALPVVDTGDNHFLVEWSDGVSTVFTGDDLPNVSHEYDGSEEGDTIRIWGRIEGWNFEAVPDSAHQIQSVENWGPVRFTGEGGYFKEAAGLNINANDLPDLTNTTSLARMFSGCESLGSPSSIRHWDVSAIEDMSEMFLDAGQFNAVISAWDVSSVRTMESMFALPIATS